MHVLVLMSTRAVTTIHARATAEFSRLSHRVPLTGKILVYIGGRICTGESTYTQWAPARNHMNACNTRADGQVVPRKREEPHDPETDAIEALKVDGDVYICTPKSGSHGMLSCRDLSKAINALQTKAVLVVLDG